MQNVQTNHQTIPSAASHPVLDEEAFESLLSLTDETDSSGFVTNLIDLFHGVGAGVVLELKAAAVTLDANRIARLAHKLKGSSRNLGALRLGATCEELEQLAFSTSGTTGKVTEKDFSILCSAIECEFNIAWERLKERSRMSFCQGAASRETSTL